MEKTERSIPIFDQSISVNFFKIHQKLFNSIHGPGNTLHDAIKLFHKPSLLANLTPDETRRMFAMTMKHRRGLKTDAKSTILSAIAYLIWGIPLGKTAVDCYLDSLSMFDLYKLLIKSEEFKDFICLSSKEHLWNLLDERTISFLKKSLGNVLLTGFDLCTHILENLFIDENSMPKEVILAAIGTSLSDPMVLKHKLQCFFHLTETYAQMVKYKHVPEDKPKIEKILRSLFALPAKCACCTGKMCLNNIFMVTFQHIRRLWDFAFGEDDASCTEKIVCHNTNDLKYWVMELLNLEKVLALEMPFEEFFDTIESWFPTVRNLRADLFLMAIEYYLMISNFLDVTIMNPKELVQPLTTRLMKLVDKLLASKTYFAVDPNIRVKGACILSDLNYDRLFALYLMSIDFYNFVPTKSVHSQCQFCSIVLKNDYSCFTHIMNRYGLSLECMLELHGMTTNYDDMVVLMVLNETRRSFSEIKKEVENGVTTIFWRVPEQIVELPADYVEAVFWSFRLLLLHYIGIPLGSSKLHMDVDGVEGIDPSEFQVILNFVIERYFALNRLSDKVYIKTILPPSPENDPNSPDYIIDD